MPLNPTTIKLTDADESVIAELQKRHGHTTLIGTIRDSLLFTLIHKDRMPRVETKSKKSQKGT